ncbi:hypothetical protein YK56LOC_69760 [Caballeronia sp. HLA56]
MKLYLEDYVFEEFSLGEFGTAVQAGALALIRDEAVWSQLVPCREETDDMFAVFRFHFPVHADNSGFVGWLASHLKRKFGTGVFVTCGQNNADGGIFDYWGVPVALRAPVFDELRALTQP